MASFCQLCGRPVDRFRDVVRVTGMRVEVLCRGCAAGTQAAPARTHGRSPQRSTTAKLRPRERRRAASNLWLFGGALAVVSIAILAGLEIGASSVGPAPAAATSRKPVVARVAVRPTADVAPSSALIVAASRPSSSPPRTGIEAVMHGDWTHPLPGPFRDLPTDEQRSFGAYRPRAHYRTRFCGQGHCGVDLGYNFGLPVLAARDGTVERVVRHPTPVEGKYIKIQHPGGLRTYYMHLGAIAPDLAVGMHVHAGQLIGTLGRTGIKISPPHLHFMITFESHGKELYVDPEPLLEKARLVELGALPAWVKETPSAR